MVSADSWNHVKISASRFMTREQILLAIGALGIAMRLYVVHVSVGCNDMKTWSAFGSEVHEQGLGYLYDNDPGFNHPPLMGLMAGFCTKISHETGVRFEELFKAPAVLADMLSAMLIYRSWQWRRPRYAAIAFSLFCWSPVSILVTAFHGNTDSIGAAFSLLAALLIDRSRPLLGGIALGAAANVKLIPLMLVPVLISSAGGPRRVGRFLVGLSTGAIPFVPVLIWHWKGFYAHAALYRSNLSQWGITGLLAQLESAPNAGPFARVWNLFWGAQGAVPILLAMLVFAAINVWKGRWDARTLTACGYASFLFLTPGFGVQYLIYPVPALFSVNVKRGLVYSLSAGLYAFLIYYTAWNGSHPIFEIIPAIQPVGVMLVGYGAWLSSLLVVTDIL